MNISTGTGLFLGLVFVGMVFLYLGTKDRWNWILISKFSPALLIVIIEIYLITSGSIVLINQVEIPKEGIKIEGYDLFTSDSRVIIGRYFDGRRFSYQVFNYSPNGFLGRRNLPFIIKNN